MKPCRFFAAWIVRQSFGPLNGYGMGQTRGGTARRLGRVDALTCYSLKRRQAMIVADFIATMDPKAVFSVVFMENLVYLTCDS